jgi:cell division protein FtsW (lipid II flippase)
VLVPMIHKSIPMWIIPCIPITVGTLIMLHGGASPGRWGLHILVGLLGVATYIAIAASRRTLSNAVSLGLVLLGVALVASTLLGSGLEGVRRWHELAGLRIHPSALVVPALLVFAAAQSTSRPFVVYGLLAALQLVHVLQPDAGQATTLGAGAAAIALTGPRSGRDSAIALCFGLSALAVWTRIDPLPPAAFVEDIIWRAFELAPTAGGAALASIALFVLTPYVGVERGSRSASVARARASLLLYFAGALVAASFGEFPVPLLGFGPSPILGAFLGLGMLQRLIRACPREDQQAVRRSLSRP